MALIEFTFGGGARTGVELGSLSISQSYGSRDSASFTIYSLDDSYSPAAGDDLGIFVDGTRIFGGKVLSVTRTMQQGTTRRANAVQASGYELLLDSRQVTGTNEYVNSKLNDVLRDLVNTYAAGDGIDLTSVPAGGGPTVTRLEISDLRSVSDAITAACDAVSRKWVIDADKKLKTIDVTSGSSLYTIGTSSSNVLANTFEVSESLEEYANRITLRMPNATTDLQTESFVGDGTTKQWTLVYPVASVPTVDVNGTAKTIGIDGVDTGKDFYWNAGSAVITQDSGASALTGSETLTVAYIGTALVSVTVNDTAQQAARAAIELTSGIYHSVRELTAVASAASATQLANALLTAAARPSFRAQWTNAGAGAEVIGSRVTINRLGISSTIFAIKEIRWDTISNEVRKTMVAFSGGVTRDGFEAFEQFSGGGGSVSGVSTGGIGGTADSLISNVVTNLRDTVTLGKDADIARNYLHWTQGDTARDWRIAMQGNGGSDGATDYSFAVYHANGSVSSETAPGPIFFRWLQSGGIEIKGGAQIHTGSGSPESSVTAPPGSLYLRSNGQVWRKASGSGNTGWVDTAVGIDPAFFAVNPVVASVTPDWGNGKAQEIDLFLAGGPTTINAPTGGVDGLEVTIMLVPRTYAITWDAAWKLPDWAVVDPSASTYTLVRWKYDGSTLRLISFLTGVPL